jgi:hypothetical protein
MAYKNRYYRTIPNSQAQCFVARAVAYSDDTTVPTFAANAVEGEVAVIVASTGAVRTTVAGVLTAGMDFYLLFKRNGRVERTPVMKYGTATIAKRDEVAAAKNKWTIGTSPAIPTPVVGDVFEVTLIDQTPGPLPFPTYHAVWTAKTTTIADTVDGLVARINANPFCTIVASRSANTLVLDARDNGTIFKVVLGTKFGTASVVETTLMNLGSGTPDQVLLYERASDVFLGATHLEDNHRHAQPADFGLPTSFVDPAASYIAYNFITENVEASPTPVEKHFRQRQFILFVPASGTTPETALNTILGT